jgi:aryl-alcohol dehydrogenase-like predicted oxidoreductase
MTFGEDWGWGAAKDESRHIYNLYRNAGGNFIDTANLYTNGSSETLVGEFMQGHRDQMVLATKYTLAAPGNDANAAGNQRKSMVTAIEASLKRLKTDYIDLYWLHMWDQLTDVGEVMATFDSLVRSGKIRAVGLSNIPAWWATKAQTLAHHRGWEPVAALQLEYSLAERSIEWEHLPAAMNLGMSVVPWSPLANGFLTGKYHRSPTPGAEAGRLAPDSQWPMAVTLTDRHWRILDALNAIATDMGRTPAQVALNWVTTRPGVLGTLVGATTVEQLDADLDALEIDLSADDLTTLEAESDSTPSMTPHSLFARFPDRAPYVRRQPFQRPTKTP